MEKNKPAKFDYDFENDSLFIFPKSRQPEDYKISQNIDNYITLDLDKQGKVIGVEILSVSKFLKIPKSYLKEISKWELLVNIDEKIINLNIRFRFNLRNKLNEKELSIERINKDMIASGFANLAVA